VAKIIRKSIERQQRKLVIKTTEIKMVTSESQMAITKIYFSLSNSSVGVRECTSDLLCDLIYYGKLY